MTRIAVAANGARLSAQVDGDADKPWLLLSNSLAADLTMWDDQIPLFTQTHRVLRYDTRGHGQSDAPAGAYDFPMLVADMTAVLDAVGAAKVDICGLSLGGMTALGLGLTHPDRVNRMLVCDARADAPEPFVTGWDDRIAVVEGKGTAGLVDGTLARWFTPAAPQSVRDRAAAMIRTTPDAGYIGCARALQTLDYLRDLGDRTVPTLYLVGEDDMGAPPAAMEAMARATPGGRLIRLPGLAHVPNMEDPAAFAAAIGDWLSGT
jgi:3-oxoadipate enol-lactonase